MALRAREMDVRKRGTLLLQVTTGGIATRNIRASSAASRIQARSASCSIIRTLDIGQGCVWYLLSPITTLSRVRTDGDFSLNPKTLKGVDI